MYRLLMLMCCLTIVSSKALSQRSQSDFSFSSPAGIAKLPKLTLWATQYYIHQFQSDGQIPIVLSDGKQTGLFADTCNFCKAALEGTAYVTNAAGHTIVINFAKSGEEVWVDCRKCKSYSQSKLAVENWGKTLWKISEGFGDGVLNYRLIPYRTIAVDKAKIPYGTVIFIPGVKGQIIVLPNGQKVKHDGYFFAGDTGGAIKENHIDIFTGLFDGNPFADVIMSDAKKTFDAYIVTNRKIINALTRLHKK